jgi:hypothetical protein
MDVRTPDSYKMEALVETTPDEIELAILASLEEEYKQLEKCLSLWDSFQELLNRLKRIGNFDKNVFQTYEILSIYLYKYSYHIYESLSEETYQFIQTHLKGIRMTHAEKEQLDAALNRLRSGL